MAKLWIDLRWKPIDVAVRKVQVQAVAFCRAEMKEEAYRIEAVQGRATLYASTPAGAAHAASALFQMILAERDRVMLPEFTLSDLPDKEWRGVMLDLARNYIPLGAILRTVDLCWLVRCMQSTLDGADHDAFGEMLL